MVRLQAQTIFTLLKTFVLCFLAVQSLQKPLSDLRNIAWTAHLSLLWFIYIYATFFIFVLKKKPKTFSFIIYFYISLVLAWINVCCYGNDAIYLSSQWLFGGNWHLKKNTCFCFICVIILLSPLDPCDPSVDKQAQKMDGCIFLFSRK